MRFRVYEVSGLGRVEDIWGCGPPFLSTLTIFSMLGRFQ